MCKALRCLPSAGGLLDQDHALVRKLMLVYEAENEKERREIEAAKKRSAGKGRMH